MKQQKMWDDFSRVEPGNSLGSIGMNTLRQHNARSDALRFTNNFKLLQKPSIPLTFRGVRANPRYQPKLIPHNLSDFGRVQFEDETPYSDYSRRNELTNERLSSSNWSEFENQNNIYMPEGRLANFIRQPIQIPEIRTHGYDRYLKNERPSRNGGVVYKDEYTGYNFGGGTMNFDNFDRKPVPENVPTSNNSVKNRIRGQSQMIRASTRL